jgi:hypothetical protein
LHALAGAVRECADLFQVFGAINDQLCGHCIISS